MANFLHSADFAHPVTVLASASQSAFLANNVLDLTNPSRPWKSTAFSSAWVGFDLGVTTTLTSMALAVIGCNSSGIRVETSATSNFAAVDDPTGVITVAQDGISGRYKHFQSLAGYTTARRYIRVSESSGGTATDSSPFFSIGALVLMTATTTWAAPAGFPYEMTSRRAISDGPRPVFTGNRYAEIGISQPKFKTSTMKATIQTLLGYGPAQPFVFYRNQSDTSEVYVVRIVAEEAVSIQSPVHFSLGNLLLREYE